MYEIYLTKIPTFVLYFLFNFFFLSSFLALSVFLDQRAWYLSSRYIAPSAVSKKLNG
jgi:hypothetical protein